MHVPDGFLDATTSLATGGVAVACLGLALRRSRLELDDRTVPLAGLTSAFIFAGQMVNIPVGLGTSGHLMGGALAAVLLGPWTGVLCLTVVLMVQALLFADGGLTALGTNITLLGVTTVLVGWVVTRGVLALLGRRPGAVAPAAAVGAFVSVLVAALVFVGLFAVGGQAQVGLGGLTVSMLAWHSVIGAGEAALTALTVGSVLAVRPDLVRAAQDLRSPLELRDADGRVLPAMTPTPPARPVPARSPRGLMLGGGVVTVVLAGVVSAFASSSPDGLERVAADRGFLASARDHLLAGSPLADYGEVGGIPVGVAGTLGVVVTIAAAVLVAGAGRSRHPAPGARSTRAGGARAVTGPGGNPPAGSSVTGAAQVDARHE